MNWSLYYSCINRFSTHLRVIFMGPKWAYGIKNTKEKLVQKNEPLIVNPFFLGGWFNYIYH